MREEERDHLEASSVIMAYKSGKMDKWDNENIQAREKKPSGQTIVIGNGKTVLLLNDLSDC